MTENTGLPVSGYTTQSDQNVKVVNLNKDMEEFLLRMLDQMEHQMGYDPRWIDTAREHFEVGFMCMNRSVFQPQRIKIKTGFSVPSDVA